MQPPLTCLAIELQVDELLPMIFNITTVFYRILSCFIDTSTVLTPKTRHAGTIIDEVMPRAACTDFIHGRLVGFAFLSVDFRFESYIAATPTHPPPH